VTDSPKKDIYTPYHSRQALDALEQANKLDTRETSVEHQQATVLAFAQVQATLAVADAISLQTNQLKYGLEMLGVTIAEASP
jgi:hypothetical protein